MTCYDVFNGDADGICALQQLRLQFPREAQRISGLKRDIDLLQRVAAAAGDEITVLDVSLDKNRDALVDGARGRCQRILRRPSFRRRNSRARVCSIAISTSPPIPAPA